jgi:hypothetical protein
VVWVCCKAMKDREAVGRSAKAPLMYTMQQYCCPINGALWRQHRSAQHSTARVCTIPSGIGITCLTQAVLHAARRAPPSAHIMSCRHPQAAACASSNAVMEGLQSVRLRGNGYRACCRTYLLLFTARNCHCPP